MSVCEGDPLGSRDAGTIKSLAESTLTAIVGQRATLLAGGQVPVSVDGKAVEFVPYGIEFSIVAGPIKDGKVRIDFSLSHSERMSAKDDEDQEIQTKTQRKVRTVRTGEIVKLRVGKGTEKHQTWVEFTVGEGHPLPENELSPLKK